MFWLPAVISALQSNNATSNAATMSGMQGAAAESAGIREKRNQRNQIADNVGMKNSGVDIDSIVSSLFPNKKKPVGGFNNNGLF